MVETMQFRDFLFAHNPEEITVWQPREVAGHFCPGKGEITQSLGPRARTVRCKGCFFGGTFAQAAAQLAEFRRRAAESEQGMLLVPGIPPFLAHLKAMSSI